MEGILVRFQCQKCDYNWQQNFGIPEIKEMTSLNCPECGTNLEVEFIEKDSEALALEARSNFRVITGDKK